MYEKKNDALRQPAGDDQGVAVRIKNWWGGFDSARCGHPKRFGGDKPLPKKFPENIIDISAGARHRRTAFVGLCTYYVCVCACERFKGGRRRPVCWREVVPMMRMLVVTGGYNLPVVGGVWGKACRSGEATA